MGEFDDTVPENGNIYYLSDGMDGDSRPPNETNAVLKPPRRLAMNSRAPPSLATQEDFSATVPIGIEVA